MKRFWRNGEGSGWLLGALAEAAAVLPWFFLGWGLDGTSPGATGGTGVLITGWLLVAAFFGGALWERWGQVLSVGAALWQAGGMLLPVAAAALLLPWWGVPFTAYLWYRGARQSSGIAGCVEVAHHLGWQALLQAAALVAVYAVGTAAGEGQGALLTGCILLLFGAGLALLVQARRREVQAEGDKARGDLFTPILLVVAALGAALAAALMTPGGALGGRITAVLASLWDGLAALLGVLAYPFALLLQYVLVPFFRRIGTDQKMNQLLAEPPEQPEGVDLQPGAPALTPEMLSRYGTILFLVGSLVVLTLALLRFRRRGREEDPEERDEERISLGFWRSLRHDLQSLGQRTSAGEAGLSNDLREAPERVESGSPRWLYRQLQGWGHLQGRPRRPGETPEAYAQALAACRPDSAEAVRRVTGVYEEDRYASAPPDPEAVAAAQETLERIRRGM